MNLATKKLKDKGYTIKEFCDFHLISLRTYRRYELTDSKKYNWLHEAIDSMEAK